MERQTSLTIYHPGTNAVLYVMDKIFEGCTEKFTLMQEDCIELKFNTAKPVYFPVGAWTFWNGKQYQVTEQQTPTCNTETGGYEYTLKMEAYYRAWNLRIYKYEADDESVTGREATFSLTANLEEHAKLFVKMLNKEGYRYETQDTETGLISDTAQEFTYSIKQSDADKRLDTDGTEISNFTTLKTLTYESTSYLDALTQIAEEWETEWWVEGNIVCFGKKEDTADPVDFILGKNVESMEGSKSQTDYATRVYAFGGTQNIPANWNKGDCEFTLTLLGTTREDSGDVNYWYKLDKTVYQSYFTDNLKTTQTQTIQPYGGTAVQTTKTPGDSGTSPFTSVTLCQFRGISESTYPKDCITLEADSAAKPHIIIKSKSGNASKYIANIYAVLQGSGGTTQTIWSYIQAVQGSTFGGTTVEDVQAIKWLHSDNATAVTVDGGEDGYTYYDMGEIAFDDVVKPTGSLTRCNLGLYISVYGHNSEARGNAVTIFIGKTAASGNIAKHTGSLYFNFGEYTQITTVLTSKKDSEYQRTAFVRPGFPRVFSASGDCILGSNVVVIPVTAAEISAWDYDKGDLPVLPENSKVMMYGLVNSQVPSWYFPQNVSDSELIKAMAETHLALPSPYYVDATPGEELSFKEIVEKILVFEDIYPRTKTKITDVATQSRAVNEEESESQEDADGNLNKAVEMYTAYYIKQDDFTFDTEYLLKNGENLQVTFQDGALAGLTFDCVYNLDSAPTDIFNKGYFYIQRKKFDGGIYLPNLAQRPEKGDKFILLNWDVTWLPELGLIEKAQKELSYATQNEIKKMNIDPTTYECTLFSDSAYGKQDPTLIANEDGTTILLDDESARQVAKNDERLYEANVLSLSLGRRVNLYNAAYFKSGVRESRIMGWERQMDIPWDSPKYSVGEKAVYSRLADIEKRLSGTQGGVNTGIVSVSGTAASGSTGSGTQGGSGVYLIQTNDGTQPTDANAYSAARTAADFISRKADEEATGQITFRGGTVSHSSTSAEADTAADGIVEYYEA